MNSLTSVRKKHPNYPVEFKIKMVELSYQPSVSVAQLAREQGINDNLLFNWRQYGSRHTLTNKHDSFTVIYGRRSAYADCQLIRHGNLLR